MEPWGTPQGPQPGDNDSTVGAAKLLSKRQEANQLRAMSLIHTQDFRRTIKMMINFVKGCARVRKD